MPQHPQLTLFRLEYKKQDDIYSEVIDLRFQRRSFTTELLREKQRYSVMQLITKIMEMGVVGRYTGLEHILLR